MNISIATVFKELYKPFLDTSLIKRAQEKKIIDIDLLNFFECVSPKQRIDAPTFGPGAGMLIKPEVVEAAVNKLEKKYGSAYKIFFSPQGKKLTQPFLKEIARKAQDKGHLMLLPARYEGMDARVEQEYADEIVSVGDFVLMGGDIPAMILLEGMLRFFPGIVGKQESVEQDSFSGPFVDYPEFTEPVIWHDLSVPEIIRSGNHQAIKDWREQQAVKNTVLEHFDWIKASSLSNEQKQMVFRNIPHHYVALMHDEVLIGPERQLGTTSVMSIDLHDIARSSCTYGVREFSVVTPLRDQQKVVNHFLSFWQKGGGVEYNKNRHQAINLVRLQSSLNEVIQGIEEKEGVAPIIVATSARKSDKIPLITYHDQSVVWNFQRPVLLLFGTGYGLSDTILSRADFLLGPVSGFTDFNHLSVRSAVAIILDRWLGINECYTKKLSGE